MWVDFWSKAVRLEDKQGRREAFVVLRESEIESRSICGASAEHCWSMHGAYMEHLRVFWARIGEIREAPTTHVAGADPYTCVNRCLLIDSRG